MPEYVCVREYMCVCVNMNVCDRVRVVVVSMLHNLGSLILRLNKIQAIKSTNLVGLKLTKIKIYEMKY
jgi:hypothetical protein